LTGVPRPLPSTTSRAEPSALLIRLERLRRAVALIRRTRVREDAQVMLYCLLADLRLLDALGAEALSASEAALLSELRGEALALRKSLGRPISPDDLGKTRAAKEAKEGAPRRRQQKAPSKSS
jgi:hypothetical protein